MPYRRNKNFKKQDKNYFTNKTGITVPELPNPKTTPSTFAVSSKDGYKSLTTPWQSYRNFDAELNKIEVNIAGYAQLFGQENNKSSLNLGTDIGLFTGAFNDIYNSDNFSLLATIMRDISINYWGLDFTPLDDTTRLTKITDHAFTTWEKNTNTILSLLDQAMYTDLRFLQWVWQDGTDGHFSKYNTVLSTQSYMLLSYQIQLVNVMITMLNFEMLTAQLPLLQELYKDKSDFIVQIQNQLKRSQFTSRVRSILTWLKRRFIDVNFFKEFILPTSIVSKETNGLNSPIVYLRHTTNIPLEPIAYVTPTDPNQIPVPGSYIVPVQFFMDDVTITYDTANGQKVSSITGAQNNILSTTLDAFNINTVLDILMSTSSTTLFSKRLETWLNTGLSVLNSIINTSLDISNQRWFRDTEAALQKLASQPSEINWKQNVEVRAINGMFAYANYQLINDLATVLVSKPEYNSNGYQIKLPIFRRAGLPNTLIHEHAQAFYVPSNDTTMSFIKLGDTIYFTTRQNIHLKGQVEYPDNYEIPILKLYSVSLTFNDKGVPDYSSANVDLNNYNSQAYLILQDNFAIIQDSMTTVTTWYNPQLISIIPALFQNKWAEYVKYATQNFIVPLA